MNNAIVEGIADCLDEQSSETYSYAPYQSDDKDWLLFNNSNEALPILDNDDFFIDADACVDSPPAYEPTAKVEEDNEDISLDDVLSYDRTEHEHINEAINDFELRSQDGYIPAEFSQSIQQENDFICILYGCSVPVVLREQKLGEETFWELVGECYVHGMMDGEAMEQDRVDEQFEIR